MHLCVVKSVSVPGRFHLNSTLWQAGRDSSLTISSSAPDDQISYIIVTKSLRSFTPKIISVENHHGNHF